MSLSFRRWAELGLASVPAGSGLTGLVPARSGPACGPHPDCAAPDPAFGAARADSAPRCGSDLEPAAPALVHGSALARVSAAPGRWSRASVAPSGLLARLWAARAVPE